MATSIWHTKIRDIQQDSIVSLVHDFLVLRGWPLSEFESSTLFNFIQCCYKTIAQKMARIPAKCVVPHGVLDTRIEKIDCPFLLAALRELGGFKNPVMPLEMYSGSKVVVFLNDYFCKKSQAKPHLYYRY